LTGTKEDIT